MALELRAEKITFGMALLLATVHAVLGWNKDSLTVLAGAIFFLLAGLKQAYLILTSVLPAQEPSETRIHRWKFALGWVLLMGGILLVAIWEMSSCALEELKKAGETQTFFWPGLAILGVTLIFQAGIYHIKRRSPGARFISPWMKAAPLVTLMSMVGFLPKVTPWLGGTAVWIIGLISLGSLILLVRECLSHSFRSIQSASLLES